MIEVPLTDLDFYERKIKRLQSDLATFQEELTTARLRLRTAEDFQIKYELLLQKSEQQNERLKNEEQDLADKYQQIFEEKLHENDQKWKEHLKKAQEERQAENNSAYNALRLEFDQFKLRHDKCGNKSQQWDMLNFKNRKLQKDNQILEEKMEKLKRQNENNRDEEMNIIKQNLGKKFQEKQEKQKQIYQDKINVLEEKNKDLENQLNETLVKIDPKRQREIQKLKQEIQNRSEEANAQIRKINEILEERNNKIQSLMEDQLKFQDEIMNDKKDLRDYIKVLESKLFSMENQHEIELLNLRERMIAIRQQEAQQLRDQITKNQEKFEEEKSIWNKIIETKEDEIRRTTKKLDDEAERYRDQKESFVSKCEELTKKLKQLEGEKESGETQNMFKGLKDLQNKETNFSDYENGVTFLDRQLKKALISIEQKNLQISKLVNQIQDIRTRSEKELEDLKEKTEKEKNYYKDKIMNYETELKELNQSIRAKDKEIRRRQNDTESEAFKLKAQNKALKDLTQEMQRDYNRIVENKTNIEKNFKEERGKGVIGKTDLTSEKKHKWLQLQRQKHQLEVLYKERQQRLKTQFQIDKENFRHERDNLRQENQLQKALIEDLKKNQKEEPRDKYSEYHKKVASLNLEIAFAQNIYDSLKQAKQKAEEEVIESMAEPQT